MFNPENRPKILAVIGMVTIVFLFILSSYLANTYKQEIEIIIQKQNVIGVFSYIFITIAAIVFAPISTMPLIPLASAAWGWVWTAFISIFGWVIGSQIAFHLARKYGVDLVKKFISISKFESVKRYVPKKNLFWSVVLLRMIFPVDLLSYALGLFSNISYKQFFFSTLLGVIPFAIIFSYVGTKSFNIQLILFSFSGLLFLLWYVLNKTIYNKSVPK